MRTIAARYRAAVVGRLPVRLIAAVLRPASRTTGKQIVRWLRRLITAIRTNWPRVEIMLRADSHYCRRRPKATYTPPASGCTIAIGKQYPGILMNYPG